MVKRIITQITLNNASDTVSVPLTVEYDCGEESPSPRVRLTIEYNGASCHGTGADDMWVDAFADLQRNLPEGVLLACCMTCRHGNLCPYGSAPNTLYCTKDVMIDSKAAMCDLFDSEDAFDKRAVFSYGYCESFVCQDADHYTYNDFLFQLKKRFQKGG